MHANSKVWENFLERSGKSQGILKSWSAGHPVFTHFVCKKRLKIIFIIKNENLVKNRVIYNDRPNFKEPECMEKISINFTTINHLTMSKLTQAFLTKVYYRHVPISFWKIKVEGTAIRISEIKYGENKLITCNDKLNMIWIFILGLSFHFITPKILWHISLN